MSGWKTVKLAEIAEFVRGINFKPDDVVPVGTPATVACMRTKNVQSELDLSDVWAVAKSFARRENQLLQVGDILVSSANSWNLVGKCCWIPELPWQSSFGGFVSVLRPQRTKVNPRFLFRWFSSDRIQAILRSFGQKTTNISNLNIDRCLKLELFLPPLEEQKRIAEILDRAESLRAMRRQSIEQLNTLTQAIFLEMFGDPVTNPRGWSQTRFEDTLSIPLRNGSSPSHVGKLMHKVLTLSAITGNKFNETAWKTSTFKFIPPVHQRVDRADFLICRGNGNLHLVGKGYFPPEQMPDVTFPDTIIAARISSEHFEREFLEHIWNSTMVRRQIESSARTTNGTLKVNQTMLENIVILTPPLPLQHEFAQRVKAIEKLKATHQKSLTELDALFASLQHRAFRGEL